MDMKIRNLCVISTDAEHGTIARISWITSYSILDKYTSFSIIKLLVNSNNVRIVTLVV